MENVSRLDYRSRGNDASYPPKKKTGHYDELVIGLFCKGNLDNDGKRFTMAEPLPSGRENEHFAVPFSVFQPKSMPVFNPATDLEQYDACIELHRAGEVGKAMEMLRNLTANSPDFALAFNALAAFYKKANDLDAAIENMKEYCALEPNDSFGFSVLSAYYIAADLRVQAEEALGRAGELRFQAQFG